MSGVNPGPGQDERLSASKLAPLDSTTKTNTPHDENLRGSAGADSKIDQTRISPVDAQGQYQNPASHADSQGVVGRDATIQETKVEPLFGALAAEKGSKGSDGTYKGAASDDITKGAGTATTNPGVDDEITDGSRIQPLGGVREEQKPS